MSAGANPSLPGEETEAQQGRVTGPSRTAVWRQLHIRAQLGPDTFPAPDSSVASLIL